MYELFVERTGRAPTIVTSNRDTAEWIAMFDEVLLAQSAVDRFTNAAYDLVIDGESYRPRLKPRVDGADPPPDTPVSKVTGPPRRRRSSTRAPMPNRLSMPLAIGRCCPPRPSGR